MPAHDGTKLVPPLRTSVDDPGAHELEGSDSDDHFSDAQSGGNSPRSHIPVTRVEKVDTEPSYGEIPGTDAYKMRTEDAQPDEIAVIPGDERKKPMSPPIDRPTTPGGHPIPKTVIEKVDSSFPGHVQHEADAEPDMVVKARETGSNSTSGAAGDLSIPTTRVEKVDSKPSHGEVPGTDAYEMRKGDAEPDVEEVVGDVPGSPTSHITRSPTINLALPGSFDVGGSTKDGSSVRALSEYQESEDGSDNDSGGFGDDFDEFEEGGEDAEFGDFDEGFQEVESAPVPPIQSLRTVTPSFPVLDFDNLDSPDEVLAATEPYISAIFTPDTIDTSTFPQPAPSHDHPIFLTQRSGSLWSQLVAPPPLQPPNWIRSRIRRLFLVSLGVPVDLDEILPASKQKKLILNLPSTTLSPSANASPRASSDSPTLGSIARLKHGDGDANASSTSLDSQGKPSKPGSAAKRRKGPPPAPELDLNSARQLCTVTDAALRGMTIEELTEHVAKLDSIQITAKEALEYWTKRTDEKLGDREAFEGVIENLVKHARKVRK